MSGGPISVFQTTAPVAARQRFSGAALCSGGGLFVGRATYGKEGSSERFEVLGARGMLQAGNHRPTEVTAATAASVAQDKPEHFFLERYRVAYAREMAHFFDALARSAPVRTTIEDGVKALELAEAATISWREKRIVEL